MQFKAIVAVLIIGSGDVEDWGIVGDMVQCEWDMLTNISDYASTSRGQFISGEMDINDDAVWSAYVAQLEEYGLNEVLSAYEEFFGI